MFLQNYDHPSLYPDINECDVDTDMCDSNATCSDTEGGYDCKCNVGYSGDGFSCSSKCGLWFIKYLFNYWSQKELVVRTNIYIPLNRYQ